MFHIVNTCESRGTIAGCCCTMYRAFVFCVCWSFTMSSWQCPLLALSVHGLQMVWECVCVFKFFGGMVCVWMEWTWSIRYVGISTSVHSVPCHYYTQVGWCACGWNELEVCGMLAYPHQFIPYHATTIHKPFIPYHATTIHKSSFRTMPLLYASQHTHTHPQTIWGQRTNGAKSGYCHLRMSAWKMFCLEQHVHWVKSVRVKGGCNVCTLWVSCERQWWLLPDEVQCQRATWSPYFFLSPNPSASFELLNLTLMLFCSLAKHAVTCLFTGKGFKWICVIYLTNITLLAIIYK